MSSRHFLLVGLLLIAPVLGFFTAEALQSHYDSQLRTEARQQFPSAPQDRIDALTLAHVCTASEAKDEAICFTYKILTFMRLGAVFSTLAGIALVAGIAIAGSLARSSRWLLLAIFKPGLYLTVSALSLVVVIDAVLLCTALYYGESALIGRVHYVLIGTMILGALVGVAEMMSATFKAVGKAQTDAVGQAVTRDNAPALWRTIDDVAERLGSLRPVHVVIGLDPTFYVTEADVLTLNGKLEGRTLFCSLPLARILSVDEFRAILGHELGHFKGADTKFSERFYPIYRGTGQSIASLHAAGGGNGARTLVLLPAIAVLSYFLERFSVAENTLSRTRELAADQAGASVTSATVMASALVKVHAFAGFWGTVLNATVDALRNGKMFVNLANTFTDVVTQHAIPDALTGIAESHLSHPTDSHPTLATRLAALQVELAQVASVAISVAPTEPAIGLVANHESVEQQIGDAYQGLIAQRLPPPSQVSVQPSAGSGGVSPVRTCKSCNTKVLPTQGGTCPRCGKSM
jgi:Zn-dependent protease with chaperone function